jgi:hypothetical protein
MRSMKAADIRDYVRRDWGLVRELKDRYWAERKRTLTPDEALSIADQLRQHAQALRPDWPDAQDRAADLQVHACVSASLRRVPSPSRG